jgi:hypothetical protein
MDYFEFYYAYLAQCERDNWANMRDPNHDYMEWNHTLPQCIFGDQPVGQWLTIEQHAIASALQTLAWKRNCTCGWHFRHIPSELLDLVKPFYTENSRKGSENQSLEHKSAGGKIGGPRGWKTCKEKQVGVFNPDNRKEWSRKGGKKNAETGHLVRIAQSGGLASGKAKWIDPDHPELGAHHHVTLMKLQRDNGYPDLKENRVRYQPAKQQ